MQRRDLDVADVLAVDAHGPFLRFVEARDQVGNGRLARAGRTDESDCRSRRCGERDAVELSARLARWVVAERHAVEDHLTGQAPRIDSALAIGDLRFGVEQQEDPLGRGAGDQRLVVETAQALHRAEDEAEQEDELEEFSDLQPAIDDFATAEDEDRDQHRVERHGENRHVRPRDARAGEHGLTVRPLHRLESRELSALGAERLDDTHAGDRLGDVR
jgi:hypothetical protein